MKIEKYPVTIAGAGPGDPELMTVKAVKALEQADLIVYAGSLVPESVLCWASEKTKKISSAGMALPEIVSKIQAAYLSGRRVVRLHTGDPAMYGAIFEQMRELQKLDIPYHIIPGVTAAFAASAKMKMEYTLPEQTQTLILTRISGRTPVPETEDLEQLASHKCSMAIYLSMGHIEKVQAILSKHYGEDTLCAVAYKVSHPEEKIIHTSIKDLTDKCKQQGITRHALIIAGKAVKTAFNLQDVISSKLYDAGFSHGYRPADK